VSYDFLIWIIDAIKTSPIHQSIVGQIVNLKQNFEKLLPKNWVQTLKKSSLFLSINRSRLAFIRYLKSIR
ncbi:MAG TPA: hypothetical protein DCZ48_04700, partial [Methylococcaceae bacterium]|nr:hypothetical protein [Methylococcaceae bacterium]